MDIYQLYFKNTLALKIARICSTTNNLFIKLCFKRRNLRNRLPFNSIEYIQNCFENIIQRFTKIKFTRFKFRLQSARKKFFSLLTLDLIY